MFYWLSQIFDFLATPSDLIAIIGGLGLLAALLRWRRVAVGLMTLALVMLLVAGYSPLGPWALEQLENRYSQPPLPAAVDGIILLGGAVDAHITEARNTPSFGDAGERLTTTAALALRFPEARVILAGGGAEEHDGRKVTESAISKDVLVSLGLPAGRIELEEKSRNTCEDARETALLLNDTPGEKTWILVTSASHMPRAIACFGAAGLPVLPYPVDFRTRGAPAGFAPASVAVGLTMSDLAAHEWIGLLTYRLTGRIDNIWPIPMDGYPRSKPSDLDEN